MIDRRTFLGSASLAGFSLAAGTMIVGSSARAQSSGGSRKRPPRLALEQVEEFVGAAHRDLERVRALLQEEPRLVNATWDWGGGDFESALGGASHMGAREIALYLLDHGARMDLFAAAMLGRLEVVKAALTLDPKAIDVPGPHGIPLIVHAEHGGEPAAEVLAYLESLKA